MARATTQRLNEEEGDGEQIITDGFSAHGSPVQVVQPEIINALQLLPVAPEVISRASAIFYQLNRQSKLKSIKGSRKVRTMFACISLAFNELGVPVDPNYAADLVHLDRTNIEQALNECFPASKIIYDPILMIRFYIYSLNESLSLVGIRYDENAVITEVTKVIQICKSTKSGEEWVQNNAGKIVAITALYFYLNDLKRYDISKYLALFEQACYLSWACIRRYHAEISRYYNMEEGISHSQRAPLITFLK